MNTRSIQTFWRLVVVSAILVFSAGVQADDIWLRELKNVARKGDANAQYRVAAYYIARGIYKQGVDWYIAAAESGHPRAQYELADMYMNGDKVPKSFERALYWYRKSAENGYMKGQAKLGIMYMNGGVVEKDLVQAYRWLRLAGSQGNIEAAEELSEMENGMSQDQIDAAEALVAGKK